MALKVFCVVEALVAERTHCDTAGEIFILLENKKQVYQNARFRLATWLFTWSMLDFNLARKSF